MIIIIIFFLETCPIACSRMRDFATLISISNRMNASTNKDLHYERYLKILSKLHEPLGHAV